ncbi:hypothetical protein GCM10009535_44770 [Streptomyces thermocarboxydovorans]|uniref:Uncharacterized protein n=1 Tax=Streptomyces thermocarboxydovorans TaxID=59298 RepID=A0ABN1HNC9_9ACTN
MATLVASVGVEAVVSPGMAGSLEGGDEEKVVMLGSMGEGSGRSHAPGRATSDATWIITRRTGAALPLGWATGMTCGDRCFVRVPWEAGDVPTTAGTGRHTGAENGNPLGVARVGVVNPVPAV